MNEIKVLVKKFRKNRGSLSAREFEQLQDAAALYTADQVEGIDHSGPGAPPHHLAVADLNPTELSALAGGPEQREAGGFVGTDIALDAAAAADAYKMITNPPLEWAGFRPVEESRAKRAGSYIAKWCGRYLPFGARILDHVVTICVCLAGIFHSVSQGKKPGEEKDGEASAAKPRIVKHDGD